VNGPRALIAALLACVACGSDAQSGSTDVAPQGRAAKGAFSFAGANGATVFPDTIPVGSRFHLTYRRNGRLDDGPEVQIVSSVLVRREGADLVAAKPGVSVFFVEDLAGHVLDEIAVAVVSGVSAEAGAP